MASLEDYLGGARISGRKASEYDKLVKSLTSYGSTYNVAQALGADTDTNAAMGVLDFLISPERGVLTAPARGVRTLVAGPEAAAGFGNVGGLKIQPDDSPLEQAGKLVGAFALDVATDPISYIGAPTSIGRAGVSKIASSLGPSTIKSLSKAANIDEGVITNVLANRSRVGQAASLQRKAGMTDEEVEGLAVNLIDKDPAKYAGMEMGSILGDALYTRGRRGVIADIASVASLAGADEETAIRAARQVFSELPEEVKGGVRFLNPLTGRSIARLAPEGSSGALESIGLGAVADVANRARLGVASTVGAPATRFLSGQSGPILQGVKKAAKGQRGLPEPALGRPTILDWSQFGKEIVKRDDVLWNLQVRYLAPVWVASKAVESLGKENSDSYYDLLFQYLTRRKVTPTPGTPDVVVSEAQNQAKNVREALNGLRDELNDSGFDVADLSDNFVPLMFTDEAAEKFKQIARSGRISTGYTGAGGRKFGFKAITDPESGDDFGFLIEGFDDVYAANPRTAGKLLAERMRKQGFEGVTEDWFVTDPIASLTKYVQVSTERLSTKRFVDSIVESGLGVRDVSQTVRRLRDRATATLSSTLLQLAPEARAAAENARKQAQDELASLAVDGKTMASAVRTARDNAERAYISAKTAEMSAAKAAREARDAVAKARLKPREMVKILREYAKSGASVSDTARAQADAANAAARASRANLRANEAESVLADLETLASTLDNRYDSLTVRQIDEVETGAIEQLISADEAALFATTARQFAQTMSAARTEVEGRLSSSVLESFTKLEQAVVRQAEAAEAYAAASTARRELKSNFDRLNNIRRLEQADSLNVIVDTLLTARAAVRKAISENADEATIVALREQEAVAQEAFDNIIKESKRFGGELGDYVRNLEEVANKLTKAEFEAAAVLSSETKLQQFVDNVSATYTTPEEIDAVFTDLVQAYNNIRFKITDEQLDALSPEQRSVIKDGVEDIVARPTERSKFGQMLSANLGDPNAALHPIGGAFEDVYAPLEIKKSLDTLFDMTHRRSEWQKKIEDYLDPALLLWRLQATQLRGPGYTMLNLSGGTVMNMIGSVSLANSFGSAQTIKKFIEAGRQIRKEYSTMPDIAQQEKIRLRLRELVGDQEYDDFEAWLVRGGADSSATVEQIRQASRLGTQASDIALTRRGSRAISPNVEPTTAVGRAGRGAVNFVLTNPVTSFVSDVNQTMEMYLRYAAFKQGVENFNNYDAAMDLSLALHFNYADLSQAEKWVRRFVPFYTWIRNNIPLQIRTMFLQPGKIQKFLYAQQELENAYGDEESWLKMLLPEYAQISGGFAVKVGDDRLFFVDRMPYQDLNRMFQVGGFPIRTRELAGSIGPVGGLYGILSGVDTGTGRAFDPAGTPAPLWARALSPVLPRNAEGEPLVPEPLVAAVNEALPFVNFLERAAGTVTGVGPTTQTDRRLSNLLNLTGVSGTFGQAAGTLTPSTARGELRRRQTILNNRVIAAAEQMNVDVDWVRDQLDSGIPPETVLRMIMSGAGRRVAGQELPSGLDVEDQQALQRLVEGF